VPLSVVITVANTPDMMAATNTLDSIVVNRPHPRWYRIQHLCLGKGYDFPEMEREVLKRRYVPHIRHEGEKKKRRKKYKRMRDRL
jgi:putative transposase